MYDWLRTEVQQQAHFQVRRAKVIEKLALVRGSERSGRFHFDDDSVLNQQIQPISSHLHASEHRLDQRFFDDMEATKSQLNRQRTAVDAFEKAESQLIVAEIEGADDRAGQLSLERWQSILPFLSHPSRSAFASSNSHRTRASPSRRSRI